MAKKCIITCALNDPSKIIDKKELLSSAKEAYEAGASVLNIQLSSLFESKPAPINSNEISNLLIEIKSLCENALISLDVNTQNLKITEYLNLMELLKPDIASIQLGSLNFLNSVNGKWEWDPILLENPASKIKKILNRFQELNILAECECFDVGIIRSIKMYREVNMLQDPVLISLVMGYPSGMPSKSAWLPLLKDELPYDVNWHVKGVGGKEVWNLYRTCAELGGHLRIGVGDSNISSFGEEVQSNGELVKQLVSLAEESGRSIASPTETKEILKRQ